MPLPMGRIVGGPHHACDLVFITDDTFDQVELDRAVRSCPKNLRPCRTTMSLVTSVTPTAPQAVSAANWRSCSEQTNAPDSAFTSTICGSKNHERCIACTISSLILETSTRGLIMTC